MLERPTRKQLIVEALIVAAAIVVFYAPHLDSSRMQSGGDFANLFWPMKEFRLDSLRASGALPLWNPYIFLGSPAAATMQHAVFYPIDYLFFWHSPTIAALNWYVLFHSILCGLGAWFWMRFAWQGGTLGSLLCGALYPCTGWFWGAQEHINQIAAVAWMPWLLALAFLRATERLSAKRFVAWYAGLGALQFLAGHPQAAFYTHGVAGLLIAARGAFAGRHAFVRQFGSFLAAGALLGLLVCVQLLPALELSRLSYRQFQDVDPAYSMSFSMPPDVLRTYIQPHAFGNYVEGYVDQRAYNEYGLYIGPGPMFFLAILGATGLVFARRWKSLAFLALLIVATLLMAMGGNVSPHRIATGQFTEFPAAAARAASVMQDVRVEADGAHTASWSDWSLHELYIKIVPPARGFRVPSRVLVLTALAWLTLAGMGLDLFAALARARHRLLVVLCMLLVPLLWLVLYFASAKQKFRFPKDTAPLLLEWDQDRALRDRATLDGRLFRLTIRDLDLTVSERERPAESRLEDELGGNGIWQRWMRLMENDNVVLGMPALEGYEEGLAPIVRTKDFLFAFHRNTHQFRPDGQFLALLGVNRIFSDLPVDTAAFPFVTAESRSIRAMYDVPEFRGAAFWAGQAHGVDFGALEGPYWTTGDPLGTRQTEARPYGNAPDWAADNWPRLTTDVTNPNRVLVRSTSDVPGDAILSMAWFPDWRLDGEEAHWLGAAHVGIPQNAFHDGVAELRYEPRSYRVGLFLSALGLTVLGMMVRLRTARPLST